MSKKYTLIYADPPWTYRDKAKDGERGAGHKYQTMTVLDICRLPVWELAAENCLLAMWWVPTQPLEALRVVEAWGFRLMTMKGFTWNKCYSRQTDKLALGMGHMTRANSEDCLFAVQGKLPARLDAGIVQSFTAPRLEHSRKPDIVREKLVQLLLRLNRHGETGVVYCEQRHGAIYDCDQEAASQRRREKEDKPARKGGF